MERRISTETIIGFDSAWTDTVPGAICSITHRQGEVIKFNPPRLIQFKEAADTIKEAALASDFALVALDQPTLVPNASSMRPVERVAGSIVNAIGGGVQPANRGKASMFGNQAPVWNFLERVGARENPAAARSASDGLFLIEVFPALALPAIIPDIWRRRRAAKYNPSSSNFSFNDWQLVTNGVAIFAAHAGLLPVASVAIELSTLSKPRKQDQDKVDALVCLLIGWVWRYHPRDYSAVIGDGTSGYIVTPVSPDTKPVLAQSAVKANVALDSVWSADARRTLGQSDMNLLVPDPECFALRRGVRRIKGRFKGKTCPECGHTFQGSGWGGVDAHWRAYHEGIMPYKLAWPIIRSGGRPSSHEPNKQ